MRILNREQLLSCGNKEGRKAVLSIMEAGLKASDPYQNTMELLHRDGDTLYIGNPKFEADNDPASGIERVDLKGVGNIYVVGAGKGIQRVGLALEEVLGDRLTGGVILCKHGDTPLLKKIHVFYGAHPVPDEGCIAGCRAIVELSSEVTEKDIVFTIMANGCSSLLTLPEEEVSLEDVRRITSLLQIEKGVTTIELNMIRNHVDQLKGGKISRLFQKAMQFHLVVADANHHVIQAPRHDYYGLLHGVWLHSLPESSTFADAIEILRKYNAWEECPESIRKCLENGTQEKETVKFEEFIKMRFRVFGIMPDSSHFLPAAQKEAERLGYKALILSQMLQAEARECGRCILRLPEILRRADSP